MSHSSEFHTSNAVLLAVGTVFCGISVAVLLPLLQDIIGSQVAEATAQGQATAAAVKVGNQYAEFFPVQRNTSWPDRMNAQLGNGFVAHPKYVQAASQVQTGNHLQGPQSTGPANPFPAGSKPVQHSGRNPFKHNDSAPSQVIARGGSVAAAIARDLPGSEIPRQIASTAIGELAAHGDIARPASSSVFAPITIHPVTVNVDGSVFESQVNALAERVESAIKATQQTTTKESDQQHQAKATRSQAREEEIAKIGDGVEQLAMAFRQLQQETRESLLKVQQQASRSPVSTELLESYRHALEREQLAGQQITRQRETQQQLAQQQLAQQQLAQQQLAQQQLAQQQFAQQQTLQQEIAQQAVVQQRRGEQAMTQQAMAQRALAQQQRLAEQNLAQQALAHQKWLAEQTRVQQHLAEQIQLTQKRLTDQQLAMEQAAAIRLAVRPPQNHTEVPQVGALPPIVEPAGKDSQLVPQSRHIPATPIPEVDQNDPGMSAAPQQHGHSRTARSRTTVFAATAIPAAVQAKSETHVVLSGDDLMHRGDSQSGTEEQPFTIPTLPQLSVPPVSVEIRPDDAALESRSLEMVLPTELGDEELRKLETRNAGVRQTSMTTTFDAPERDFPIDINLPPTKSHETAEKRKVVEPVGFENVYRFEMKAAEDGELHVVPAEANVCAQCGKVHAPGKGHSPVVNAVDVPATALRKSIVGDSEEVLKSNIVLQTSGNLPSTSFTATNGLAEIMASPARATDGGNGRASKLLHGDVHVGGRGKNRHLQQSGETPSAEGRLPKIRIPSFTTEDDEPSVLHRMSSTIMQLGRSVR